MRSQVPRLSAGVLALLHCNTEMAGRIIAVISSSSVSLAAFSDVLAGCWSGGKVMPVPGL